MKWKKETGKDEINEKNNDNEEDEQKRKETTKEDSEKGANISWGYLEKHKYQNGTLKVNYANERYFSALVQSSTTCLGWSWNLIFFPEHKMSSMSGQSQVKPHFIGLLI